MVVSGNASEAFSRAIREISRKIGGKKVLTDPEDLIPYSIDASKRFEGAPWAVVRVSSTEDVAAVLEVADRERIPVIPRGSASCLTGAVVAKRGGIVIDLLPMNRVEVYPEDMVVMAEAGATVQKVDKECRRHGLMFPPDPASSKVATVGGALAENAGGIRGAKYGVMKNWLLALEVVLPGGRVLR
ncbi:MAG TPA: FAD-binding oxidoreductase, partial [Candidatus Korarchaeota archaeon]|nr:FAD-binding oxidoreductase [Candidatus Korarchaeota archaeon]